MVQNQQRDWLGQISLLYPNKWIVVVNVLEEVRNEIFIGGKKKELKDYSGQVHFVVDKKYEAWEVMNNLDASYGDTRLVEGFDDTPQIEGLFIYE